MSAIDLAAARSMARCDLPMRCRWVSMNPGIRVRLALVEDEAAGLGRRGVEGVARLAPRSVGRPVHDVHETAGLAAAHLLVETADRRLEHRFRAGPDADPGQENHGHADAPS